MSAPAAAVAVREAWEEVLTDYEEFLLTRRRLSVATTATYMRHLGYLSDGVRSGPWGVTSEHLTTWLARPNWSRDTRRKVVISVRLFYAWAIYEGHLEWAPTAGLATSAAQRPGPSPSRIPDAWWRPWCEYQTACVAAGQRPGTIEQRRWHLLRLAMVGADPWRVTRQQLQQYLSDPEWSPNFRRVARSNVRAFYRWALRAGYVEVSPAQDLDRVRVPRAVPRPIGVDALRQALAAVDDRTRLAIMLGSYAGLRRAEIARLHTSQITHTHLLVTGKGGHQRFVPLHRDLAREIREELDRRREGGHGTGWSGEFVTENGYLFPSTRSPDPITPAHLAKTISTALPGAWTTHSLRHRFATAAYAADRDLLAVQRLLGHAKPETTAGYAAVPDASMVSAVGAVGI